MSLVVNNPCKYDWFNEDNVPPTSRNNPSLIGRIYSSHLCQGDGTGGTLTINHILPVIQQVYGEHALVKLKLCSAYSSAALAGTADIVNWDFQTGELVSDQLFYLRFAATIGAGQWGHPLPLMPEDFYMRCGGGLMSSATGYIITRFTNNGTGYFQASVYLTVHDRRYL